MQLNDAALEQLLADVQNEYEKSDQKWMPDPGDYLCKLIGLFISIFAGDDGETKILSVQPEFLIVGGQLEGRTFRYRLTNRTPGTTRFLREFIDKCLTAEEYGLESSGNLRDDLNTVNSLVDRLFVTVRTNRSKPNAKGETYLNATVKKVESVEEAAGSTAAAA